MMEGVNESERERRKLWFIHHKYGFDNFFFHFWRGAENGKNESFLFAFLWFSFSWFFFPPLPLSTLLRALRMLCDVCRVEEVGMFLWIFAEREWGDLLLAVQVEKLFIDGIFIFNEHLSTTHTVVVLPSRITISLVKKNTMMCHTQPCNSTLKSRYKSKQWVA